MNRDSRCTVADLNARIVHSLDLVVVDVHVAGGSAICRSQDEYAVRGTNTLDTVGDDCEPFDAHR